MMKSLTFCRNCGGRPNKVGHISRHRLCVKCQIEISTRNTIEIVQRKGPAYEKWRAGIKAYADNL